MANQSFLQSEAARQIHELGKRREWWPFGTADQLGEYFQARKITLRGNCDFLLVGLNRDDQVVVQEIQSITDTTRVTERAFVLSYKHLLERVFHENTN